MKKIVLTYTYGFVSLICKGLLKIRIEAAQQKNGNRTYTVNLQKQSDSSRQRQMWGSRDVTLLSGRDHHAEPDLATSVTFPSACPLTQQADL